MRQHEPPQQGDPAPQTTSKTNWSSKLEQFFVSLIGPGGFEPPLTDPKSAVLPLDEGPALQ